MRLSETRSAIAAMAIFALAASPASAPAASAVEGAVVPQSNSAAAQYTETFPTSGGDKKTDKKSGQKSPSKVLGSKNAKKLQQQGPEGRAAAEAAAATAPSTVQPVKTTTTAPPSESKSAPSPGKADSTATAGKAKTKTKTPAPPAHQQATEEVAASQPRDASGGSSGLGSTVGEATGLSTSGPSGALLPLAILATVLLSLGYLWRQRRQVD